MSHLFISNPSPPNMKRNFTNKEYLEWRKKVLDRDGGLCVDCGRGPKYNNVHHLIPSFFHQYELLVDNGLTLCPLCHTLGKFSAHKNPIWFYGWLKDHKPNLLNIAEARLLLC